MLFSTLSGQRGCSKDVQNSSNGNGCLKCLMRAPVNWGLRALQDPPAWKFIVCASTDSAVASVDALSCWCRRQCSERLKTVRALAICLDMSQSLQHCAGTMFALPAGTSRAPSSWSICRTMTTHLISGALAACLQVQSLLFPRALLSVVKVLQM